MRFHSSIALAAVAAVLATPVVAEAKTKHHHAAPAGLTTREELALAQQQLAQLQAQLNALQGQVNTTAATSQSAASTAAVASTKADTALAKADAVKVEEVKTEKAVNLASWAQGTQVHGRLYFNTSAIAGDGAGILRERDGGFQIKRAYISIDHQFNKTFAFDITTDADNIVRSKGTVDDTAKSATQGIFLKKAYFEAKVDPALVVRLGASDMPWVPYVEGIYGYRHIEKTMADLNSFATSTDWGAHVGGTLFNKVISYQVSAVDGSGYRNPQITRDIDLEGRISASYMGFNLAVGGYTGKLGAALAPGTVVNGNEVLGTTQHTARRFDALAAYKGNVYNIPVTLGVEYLWAKDDSQNQVAGYDLSKCSGGTSAITCTTGVQEDTQEAISVFGSFTPVPKWSVFARYDWAKPNGYTAAATRNHYYNVGLQWEPVSVVDLALVYKHNAPDANYALGDVVKGQTSREEIGLFGQVKF